MQEIRYKAEQVSKLTLQDFVNKQNRFQSCTIDTSDCLYDYSYQRIDKDIVSLLNRYLFEETDFLEARNRYFKGGILNESENREVLHSALRASKPYKYAEFIYQERQRLKSIAEKFLSQSRFSDIIHIGIGGSDLGVRLIQQVLGSKHQNRHIHFLSSLDPQPLRELLQSLDPDKTLVVVASKTFTTHETLLNAKSVFEWLGSDRLKSQVFAVTNHRAQALRHFIHEDHIFDLPEWVGGRFSIGSSLFLTLILAYHYDFYLDFLSGAEAADQEFLNAELEMNIALHQSLIGYFNVEFLNIPSLVVAPYEACLSILPSYLQQLEMESNGKSFDRQNNPVSYPTAPLLFGGTGPDIQHSFMQWVHQGTYPTTIDFIARLPQRQKFDDDHSRGLFAHLLAQGEALAARNRSSSLFLLKSQDIKSIGYLLALYEHKVFTQGVLWNVNSFDQPAVELGKKIATRIEKSLCGETSNEDIDPVTAARLRWLKSNFSL
jgi:glucose-6-phosphate isomerase